LIFQGNLSINAKTLRQYRKQVQSVLAESTPGVPTRVGFFAGARNRQSKLSYSALVTGMDCNIGRVLQRLEDLRIRENTVIVFAARPVDLESSRPHTSPSDSYADGVLL
jgi:membrane-anchored protein YejM (alkaline phosphatase superfamily)